MPDQSVNIVTAENDWIYGGTYSGVNQGLSAFDTYSHSTTPWTSSGKRFVITPLESNGIVLRYFGRSAAGKKGRSRLWQVARTVVSLGVYNYLAVPAAEVEVALGSKDVSGGVFGTTYKVGQTISVVQDGTNTPPGIRLLGNGLGGFADMLIDRVGNSQLIIELENPTNETVELGFFYRPV